MSNFRFELWWWQNGDPKRLQRAIGTVIAADKPAFEKLIDDLAERNRSLALQARILPLE